MEKKSTSPANLVSSLRRNLRVIYPMPPASVKLEELSQYFNLPEKAVAQKMGMCLTSLKKVCRENGIMRWPFRKLKSLERTMKKVNADSNSISAQIGRSKAHAAHGSADGSSSSREGSRPPTPPAPLFQSQVTHCSPKASEISHATGDPAFQWAEVAAQILDRSNSDCEPDFPSFSVSGMHMQQLIITNWSSMWTVYHLKKHIVEQLGGSGMLISEDGSNAYLDFTSSLAALRARRVCEEACSLVRSRQSMHPTPRICPDMRSRLLDAHCVLPRPETQAAASCSHEHYSTSTSKGFQSAHAHAIHAPNLFEVRNGRIASAEEVYHIMPLSSSVSPNSNSGPPASGNILDLEAACGSQRALGARSGSVGSGVGSPPVLSISKCNPTSPQSGGSWSSSDLDWMTPCLVAC